MTPCDMGSDAAERYVAASMDDAERTSFEDHFFACDVCFRTVQALEDARSYLAEAETGQKPGGAIRPSGRGLPLQWMAAAATLVIGLGVSVVLWRQPAPASSPAMPTAADAPLAGPQVAPPTAAIRAPGSARTCPGRDSHATGHARQARTVGGRGPAAVRGAHDTFGTGPGIRLEQPDVR